jgi:hypothetical protein
MSSVCRQAVLVGGSGAQRILVGLALIVASAGCQNHAQSRDDKKEKTQKVALGEVRIGKERTELYIAYTWDAAILGFSVSNGTAPARYFPMYASTHRGVPSVVLDVFASTTEEEMWIRASWSGGELLAYHRIGADNAITQFGNVTSINQPMPEFLSGGPVPFPELNMANVVKKATFKHESEDGKTR